MYKIYLLLILMSASFIAKAQPTLPNAPVACNANSCLTNANIDVCPPGSNTVVTDHRNGVYNRGNNSDNLGAQAVWRYRNIATVAGVTINCEVRIDEISNATLNSIDDDGAVDQANVSIRSFFAPRISPDINLNGASVGTRRGYVQFTMSFFRNANGVNNNSNQDFATPVNLANINYVHYDIDGNDAGNVNSGTAGSWFRETGVARVINPGNPLVLANTQTNLSSYNYSSPGGTVNWTGFAGTTCERDGVSRCAELASSFSYAGALPSITFRMGYDYNAGNNVGRPVRQYGSRLGCFNFPSQSTLPVRLLNFNASYRNQQTILNWAAEGEVNFQKYVVERSSNGSDFAYVGEKNGSSNAGRNNYELHDDLSNVDGTNFYYRLKMIDIDGTFKYSSVLLIRKDAKALTGIAINPNPVRSGTNTVRFTSANNGMVDLRVVDISGKVVAQQQHKVYTGNNSVSLNNLDRLQPGTYVLQLINDGEVNVVKFSVVK